MGKLITEMSFQRYTTGLALITHLITHWVIGMDGKLHNEILAFKTRGKEPNNYPSTRSNWLALSKKYEVQSGRLFRNSKPVLLDHELEDTWQDLHKWLIYTLQNKLFSRFHFVMRHSGANLSWAKIKAVTDSYLPPINTQIVFFHERFYFYGGEKFCRERCRTCIPCAYKNDTIWSAQVTPLQPIPVEPKLFFRIHSDIFGPLKKSSNGNKYVAIAVDAFSKYVEFARNILISKHLNLLPWKSS